MFQNTSQGPTAEISGGEQKRAHIKVKLCSQKPRRALLQNCEPAMETGSARGKPGDRAGVSRAVTLFALGKQKTGHMRTF